MQSLIRYVVVSLLLATSSFAGVTISSPAPGSTSTSPVHFVASASSSSAIAAMRIYVDDKSVYTTSSRQLDTFVTLSSGSHRVVVVAWNTQGSALTGSETITVTTAANVNVSAPADNATVSSPFQVVASASAGNPIVAMHIYMDDQDVFGTASASLNTPITAGAGTHSLVVQAWDNTGAVYKQALTVNVSSSSNGVTVSSPANNATVSSPFQVVASASAANPIAAMYIYLDNQVAFQTNSASINTQLTAGVGPHSMVVQAWDNTGAVYKKSLSVTVGSGGGGNVNVTAPGNNATVNSPFEVAASASAPNPIAAIQVYLDSQLVFTGNGSSIDTQVSAGAGQHSLVVQAWDNTGAVYKQPLTVNVNDNTVPPNATVVSEIQQMTGWGSCTVCAGEGGNGPPASYSQEQFQSSPSLSGSSSKFTIWGSNPWADVLWWKDLNPNDNATNYRYDLDFYIATPQFSQSLEFDVNVNVGAIQTYFIFGTQCVIGDGHWDVWDTAGDRWVSTGIPCPQPAANTWHHVTWEFQRDNSQAHFVALTFDGVKHYVNMAFWAKQGSWPALNVAFQMDGDARMDTYSVWLDNVTLSYW